MATLLPSESPDAGLRIPFFHVDAFASAPFRGNPAVVCPLDAPLDDATMQAIAAEMNVSETAFVGPPGPSGARSLRWFTPVAEVPLCGHATLASGAILLRRGEERALVFETRSGTLRVEREGTRLRLDFPANEAAGHPAPAGMLSALGLSDEDCEEALWSEGAGKWLLVLRTREALERARPAGEALVRAAPKGTGVILTSAGAAPFDFVSRYFAPWVGILEDPVTGSAHTVLGPYWAARLGKTDLRAFQASRRGGELEVRLRGKRVDLVGSAVVVTEGHLRLPR
jgi:PhzF family phenazine biosynthesis protein